MANIENIKFRGSQERFGDTRTGEINASSKRDLAKKILAAMNVVEAKSPESLEEIHNEVVAAYKDKTSNKFAALGAALAGELYEVANRQGFARRLLKKVETQQGADIRMDVKFPNSVAVTAVSSSQVQAVFLRDKHYYPVSVDIAHRVYIHKQEIDRTTGDILNEKLQEGQEAIQVAEDRLWKSAVDTIAGAANPINTLVGGLTPDTLAIMRNSIVAHNLPAATIVAASDVLDDLLGTNFSSWFDPVSQYEIVNTGNIGSLLGMSIITDAFRAPTLKVLDQGDVYIVSAPEYHGGFADRGPVESTELDVSYEVFNARGWYLVETIALLVHNARSIVKGKRA